LVYLIYCTGQLRKVSINYFRYRVQNSINEEQKKEIQILQRRLGHVRQECQEQLAGQTGVSGTASRLDRSVRNSQQVRQECQEQLAGQTGVSGTVSRSVRSVRNS
jgi:hypothetical protein